MVKQDSLNKWNYLEFLFLRVLGFQGLISDQQQPRARNRNGGFSMIAIQIIAMIMPFIGFKDSTIID